jgi:coenzyme Q-binding protein COQ10
MSARYGEFLPWVTAVRVRSDSETEMVADLIVGFKALRETFTSRSSRAAREHPCRLSRGAAQPSQQRLALPARWQGGCLVDFTVDFAFRSRMFEALAGQMFDRALRKMIGAFEERAARLYGALDVRRRLTAASVRARTAPPEGGCRRGRDRRNLASGR